MHPAIFIFIGGGLKQDNIPTYILIARKYFKSPMWKLKPNQKRTKAEAYIDLFQMATYDEDTYTTSDYKTTIPLYRSEGVWSIRFLANRWNWSRGKVETFLKILKVRQKLRQESRRGVTVSFLVDYDDSQKKENYGKRKKKTLNRTESRRGQDGVKTNTIYDNNGNNDKEYIYSVVSYLNEKTGKKFKHKSTVTIRLITSRIKEGHTVEDFKKVIDNKCKDPYFIKKPQYLRPATLFSASKFEGYLNENKKDIKHEPNKFDGIEETD